MAITDWNSFVGQTDERMAALRKDAPDVAKAFGALAGAAIKPGALDSRTKELIALAIGITARCDGCLAYHARAAAKYGATREEVLEVIGVAIYMGGGPSMIYGAEALAAFDGLSQGD
ncbi:carboxymuconolactone decarboxylase family protein [Roseibium salinum]|uniref:Carboxymuconolactone decarboxylase family protein n=1 Tax=Roseibium salinum TaxID=1604349 RepID=A0ABT3R528_9HYPH|nr:carboxymuconolactone decarboxylase family protein [Roseibium sp. DSM 29163]MCX2724335.1 carboxymuconolactone decarboxylase family protein [Roseibium sp. DSM 29163]MDN3721620.1 carboxymuconolactone decarboxylase family protein [Roseibium salinum]